MAEVLPGPTRWTLLARAVQPDDSGAAARKEFAEIYGNPILEFLRAMVRDADLANDLAQEFFANRLASVLVHADVRKGGFRAYLVTVLRNLVRDQHRRDGRDPRQTHPDQWEDRGWENIVSPDFRSAEAAFHRAWVAATLRAAVAAVREICVRKRQETHFQLFQARYLGGDDRAPSWEELGRRYGIDQKAARERAETVARHFRIVLRGMLRRQVVLPNEPGGQRTRRNEAAIDQELHAMLSLMKE